uniref:erythroblast NAD(P)(+)--arginine ADP-ribosyltransferase-like n=1 Tax=Corvus brachyrhynchos TaxID=85066 RepID=UPI0008166EEB|nr:PREDICTED: erythroblast NAD(P)(+)--arginine ADP-ribosyltransferase-like [Corvus brachyrhynchos]
MSPCGGDGHRGMDTMFQVDTRHSVDVHDFSSDPSKKQVLIQPFETFKVTFVVRDGDKVHIILNSTGTHSNHNCEWLQGGSIPRDPPPPWGASLGHRGHGSDHQNPLSHKASKVTVVLVATVATMIMKVTVGFVATVATMIMKATRTPREMRPPRLSRPLWPPWSL